MMKRTISCMVLTALLGLAANATANDIQPVKPVEPAKPAEPVKPAKPMEPVKPATPLKPAQPVKPPIALPPVNPPAVLLPAQISAGGNFTCGIRRNFMWCWGENAAGQLGLGEFGGYRDKPHETDFVGPPGVVWKWRYVDNDHFHACGLSMSSQLYCWGLNDWGQIGEGKHADKISIPELIVTEQHSTNTWKMVDVGTYHSCGIMTDETLWCWGRNAEGQIGVGQYELHPYRPKAVGTDNTKWSTVSAGGAVTCAIKKDNSLWCWGDNTHGQLGINDQNLRESYTPVKVTDSWKSVSVGTYHACGITASRQLMCWGLNTNGQAGLGSRPKQYSPALVAEKAWDSVSAGVAHTCAIERGGYLWCWGVNYSGELGLGEQTKEKNTPVRVTGNGIHQKWRWRSVSAGSGHTCGLTTNNNDFYCWGSDSKGQLGNGDLNDLSRNVYYPCKVDVPDFLEQ